jgi:hypothetical protein
VPLSIDQLETWSHQGSITQSSSTYATIKGALENPRAGYAGKNYRIFLQGSYGNDTNIYAESDVDVVIVLDELAFYDTSRLQPDQAAAIQAQLSPAKYDHMRFKEDVLAALRSSFGNAICHGSKAIPLPAGAGRRKADVIVAVQQRRYFPLQGLIPGSTHTDGIAFQKVSGEWVQNFPRLHSENMTTKHQATAGRLKPLVRIYKNMRNRLYERSLLPAGYAPSYFIEGMLYNVPTQLFTGTLQQQFTSAYDWLVGVGAVERNNLACANGQYYLLRDNSDTSWAPRQFQALLDATRTLWLSS